MGPRALLWNFKNKKAVSTFKKSLKINFGESISVIIRRRRVRGDCLGLNLKPGAEGNSSMNWKFAGPLRQKWSF